MNTVHPSASASAFPGRSSCMIDTSELLDSKDALAPGASKLAPALQQSAQIAMQNKRQQRLNRMLRAKQHTKSAPKFAAKSLSGLPQHVVCDFFYDCTVQRWNFKSWFVIGWKLDSTHKLWCKVYSAVCTMCLDDLHLGLLMWLDGGGLLPGIHRSGLPRPSKTKGLLAGRIGIWNHLISRSWKILKAMASL